LALQDFFDQVIQDVAVAAGKGPNEARHVLLPAHRERGHLQPRDPTFGTGGQGSDVVRRNAQTHAGVQKSGRFVESEAQVGLALLGQLPTPPEPREGQGWVAAGGDDQVHSVRQMVEQKGEALVNRLGID